MSNGFDELRKSREQDRAFMRRRSGKIGTKMHPSQKKGYKCTGFFRQNFLEMHDDFFKTLYLLINLRRHYRLDHRPIGQ